MGSCETGCCTSVTDKDDMVAFVGCTGCAAGKERFAKSCSSCAEAIANGFQRGECKSGCVGVGSCIASCKYGALKLVDGQVVVDREKCNGCGECAKDNVCPQHLIRMIPRHATNFIPCSSTEEDEETVRDTCGHGCIACGECERVCPVGAVTVQNNHAVIDYSKCVGCSACALKCKKKIIVDTLHDIRVLKDKVAFVKCSGGKKAQETFVRLGIHDCNDAKIVVRSAYDVCSASCCGLGNCVKVCRFGALSIENGTAYVDPEKCVGCRDCVRACPQKLIHIIPYKGVKVVPCSSREDFDSRTRYCDSGCNACEDCKSNCPNGAIYMQEKHACIDPELCQNCNVCQYVCGRNVIKQMSVPDFVDMQRIAVEQVDEGAEK